MALPERMPVLVRHCISHPIYSKNKGLSLKRSTSETKIFAAALRAFRAGKPGNVILSGHNDIFGQVFRELDRLKVGDEIMLLSEKNAYTYLVTGTQIVQPSQVEVMRQTEDSTLTLISCYPYLVDTQRIVVSAELKK